MSITRLGYGGPSAAYLGFVSKAVVVDETVGVQATVELRLNGVWTDVSAHVRIIDGLRWSRGIFDFGPTACVARPGAFTFVLDNEPDDAVLAYYTPGNPNCREGFKKGVLVRLRLDNGTEARYVWRGQVRVIDPEPGIYGARRTTCVAVDWMARLAETDASKLTLLENVYTDDLVTAIVALADEAPANVDYDAGIDLFAFAFDDLGGDPPRAMEVVQRTVQSEGGFLYLRGDATDGETLRLENRLARVVRTSDVVITGADIANDPDALTVPSALDHVINDVETITFSRRVDAAATTVLVKLDAPVEVEPGLVVRLFVDYRDPAQQAVFVGGKDMVQPDPVTDYTANDALDGSGVDVIADVTVTAAYFGSRAMLEFENTGAVTAYVRGPGTDEGLQCRGRGLYRYAPIASRGINQTSIDAHGVQALPQPIEMIYQGDRHIGQDRADLVAFLYGGLANLPTRVRVLTEREDLESEGILRDIGDRITMSEQITVPDAQDGFIQALEQELTVDGVLLTWWTLAPADTSAALVFDDPDFGKFDERVFAY